MFTIPGIVNEEGRRRIWRHLHAAIDSRFSSRRHNRKSDSPMSDSGLYCMLFAMNLDYVLTLSVLFVQSLMMQSPNNVLLRAGKTATGHTHGWFVPQFSAFRLIAAQFQLLKLYWIPEKSARRNASVLRTSSLLHARNFRKQSRGRFQWKALYMEIEK